MFTAQDLQTYLPDQSAEARANDYPYAAPEGGFVLTGGTLVPLEDASLLQGRTAVLSVGSNRAPVQLRRKFGDDATVPVTPAILHDCDIVHAAAISYYGSVSCTAFPCSGTDVFLNIAWLDDDQLVTMHRTEALGVAYDYIRKLSGMVTHIPVPAAGGDIVPASQPVYGYASRSGVLDAGDGRPAALTAIPARGRQFTAMTQADAVTLARGKVDGLSDVSPDGLSQDRMSFVQQVIGDRDLRWQVNDCLKDEALHGEGPWLVQNVTADDIGGFL